jgi:predicted enzyme related to lactoylglutathione lyase
MNGGAVIFAADVDRVARFYEVLLMMSPVHIEDGLRVIASDRTELVIHQIPPHLLGPVSNGDAASGDVAAAPTPREDNAIKPFFVVPSLDKAREMAPLLGGYLFPADREFAARRFRACNACDPEGNVIQFRELFVTPT